MIIEKLHLENFKCFKETDIEFGKITLLTGANSSGKSSLISSLLTILQSPFFPFFLSPNGNLITLGNFRNMVSELDVSKSFKINFTVKDRKQYTRLFETEWEYNSINGLPNLHKIMYTIKDSTVKIFNENDEFVFEKYDREKLMFTLKDTNIEKLITSFTSGSEFSDSQLSNFNINVGVNYIESFRTNPQRNYLQVPKAGKVQTSGAGFENQIIEWEESNSPKFTELIEILKKFDLLEDLKTSKIGDGMFDIKIQTKKSGILSSLADVGYGVSKLLPIIVADLQLSKDSLLIVSEPEIDLHPSIQANFANYLFEQTKKGKQYIIETHSEYIINRLRLLIAKNELQENDVKTYFFINDGRKSETFPINFKKDGQIENAPKDFFETYEVDVMEIAMLG